MFISQFFFIRFVCLSLNVYHFCMPDWLSHKPSAKQFQNKSFTKCKSFSIWFTFTVWHGSTMHITVALVYTRSLTHSQARIWVGFWSYGTVLWKWQIGRFNSLCVTICDLHLSFMDFLCFCSFSSPLLPSLPLLFRIVPADVIKRNLTTQRTRDGKTRNDILIEMMTH